MGEDRRQRIQSSAAGRLPPLGRWEGGALGEAYEPLGVLGSDCLTETLLAFSKPMHAVVTMRRIRPQYAADPLVQKGFREATRAWVEMGAHPNVVRAFFVEEVNGHAWVVSDWVASDERGTWTLERHLQRRPPDLAQTLNWGIQLCQGLEEAAIAGVPAHRNLTAREVLITHDGTLEVGGFGVVYAVSGSQSLPTFAATVERGVVGLCVDTTTGVCIGTPSNMPPEQFLDSRTSHHASTVYSVGLLLFQMLHGGRLPFRDEAPDPKSETDVLRYIGSLYRQHRDAPVDYSESPLFPVIARSLAKDAPQRYQSYGELQDALLGVAEEVGARIDPPGDKNRYAHAQWVNRGLGLHAIGRADSALFAYNRAERHRALDPMLWRNRAAALLDLGRLDEAEQTARSVLERVSEPFAWYDVGRIMVRRGKLQEALDAFSKALNGSRREPLFWVARAMTQQALGHTAEANKDYQRAMELGPHEGQVFYRVGNGLGRQGLREQALKCFDRALAAEPGNETYLLARGNVLAAMGRHGDALDAFEQAAEMDPDSAPAWLRVAQTAETIGLLEQAADAYKEYLRLAPPDQVRQIAEIKQRLAELLEAGVDRARRSQHGMLSRHGAAQDMDPYAAKRFQEKARQAYLQGHFQDAIESFGRALALDPNSAELWVDAAEALAAGGHTGDALRAVKSAVDLNPEASGLWTRLGILLAGLGRRHEALRCHERGVEADPTDVVAWTERGLCLVGEGLPPYMLKKGEVADALECFDHALRRDLNDSRAWYAKGLAQRAQGRHQDAMRSLRRSSQLDGSRPETWVALGHSMCEVERYKEALSSADTAIGLAPSLPASWTLRARALRETDRAEEALKAAEKAVELDDQDVSALHEMGRVLLALNKRAEAIACFDEAIQAAPDDPMLLFDKGETEMAHGMFREAERTLKQFIEGAPEVLQDKIDVAYQYVRELRKKF